MPHAEVLPDAPGGVFARSLVLLTRLFQILPKRSVLDRRLQVVGECVLVDRVPAQRGALLHDLQRLDDLRCGLDPPESTPQPPAPLRIGMQADQVREAHRAHLIVVGIEPEADDVLPVRKLHDLANQTLRELSVTQASGHSGSVHRQRMQTPVSIHNRRHPSYSSRKLFAGWTWRQKLRRRSSTMIEPCRYSSRLDSDSSVGHKRFCTIASGRSSKGFSQ